MHALTCPDVNNGCCSCPYGMPASSTEYSPAVRNMENSVVPNSMGDPKNARALEHGRHQAKIMARSIGHPQQNPEQQYGWVIQG